MTTNTRDPYRPHGGWQNHPQWRAQVHHRKSTSMPTSCALKVPTNQRDKATAAYLSDKFRAGTIYAYSYERGKWTIWATQADWDATVRRDPNSDGAMVCRDPAARATGHGPRTFDPATLPKPTSPKRPTKAEAITLLRAILEDGPWTVDDITSLLAREDAR